MAGRGLDAQFFVNCAEPFPGRGLEAWRVGCWPVTSRKPGRGGQGPRAGCCTANRDQMGPLLRLPGAAWDGLGRTMWGRGRTRATPQSSLTWGCPLPISPGFPLWSPAEPWLGTQGPPRATNSGLGSFPVKSACNPSGNWDGGAQPSLPPSLRAQTVEAQWMPDPLHPDPSRASLGASRAAPQPPRALRPLTN